MAQPDGRRRAYGLDRIQEFLKQIVYGGNDGIVTTFAIVAGFAGSQAEGVAQIGGMAVLVFGLANLFADAVSMGLGEFLSGRAQHDLYRSRRALTLQSFSVDPDLPKRDLSTLLHARGLDPDDSKAAAEILARYPTVTTDLLLGARHGMHNPADDTPWINALFTFVSFVLFGAIPLVPYILLEATPQTFTLSVAATAAALVALGLLRWTATGEGLWRTLGETVGLGALCAAVAFGVGWLVGG